MFDSEVQWGSRGRKFKSSRPDQLLFLLQGVRNVVDSLFLLSNKTWEQIGSNFKIAENNAQQAFLGSAFYAPQ